MSIILPRKPLWAPLHLFERAACREAFREQFGRYPPEDSELKPIMGDPASTYWAWLPGFPFEDPPLPRWLVAWVRGR